MIYPSLEQLEEIEHLASEAADAEIQQHWYQAAILWRRSGDAFNAEYCEAMLQHSAENKLDKLNCLRPRGNTPIQELFNQELDWRER
jgi:hypothetical protein